MKTTRRGFFSLLGVASVAGAAAVALPLPKLKKVRRHNRITIRSGLPSAQWQRLEGMGWVSPSPNHRDLMKVIAETNEILADIPWKEAP